MPQILEGKPKPKLTLDWIEQTGGWPEGVGVAVVNDDGCGSFGGYRGARKSGGGWVGDTLIKQGSVGWDTITDERDKTVNFDNTDWEHSIIYNPEYVRDTEDKP